jgi:hypothetical protein
MTLNLLSTLVLGTAFAGRGGRGGGGGSADLQTTLSMPTGHDVYDAQSVQVTVANIGNKNADGSTLTVLLPETHTSPSVFVMGDLGAIDSACSQNGTQLDCSLGRIKAGKSVSVSFEISLPQSSESLDFEAIAATSSSDGDPNNDSDAASAEVNYIDTPISGQHLVTNRHCTGVGLTAFYECVQVPSSISSHSVIFEDNGDITFSQAGYTGSWAQDSDDHLWFEYISGGNVVAEFEGKGVGGDCFEGLTTFPTSSYVAPYEVCLD